MSGKEYISEDRDFNVALKYVASLAELMMISLQTRSEYIHKKKRRVLNEYMTQLDMICSLLECTRRVKDEELAPVQERLYSDNRESDWERFERYSEIHRSLRQIYRKHNIMEEISRKIEVGAAAIKELR